MSKRKNELKPGSILAELLAKIYNAQIDIEFPEKLESVSAEIIDSPRQLLDALEGMGYIGFVSGIPFVTDEGREWLKKNNYGEKNAKY
jgi:hypothetical protein